MRNRGKRWKRASRLDDSTFNLTDWNPDNDRIDAVSFLASVVSPQWRDGLKWSDQPQFIDDDEKPLIIGHRGSGLSQIEEGEPPFIGNTATAIQRGIDAKVDWLEIDIRMSKDSPFGGVS